MDKERRAYLRRQKVNVEDLGAMGQILLEKAEHWIVPIFKNGEAAAMVIEIERFDRDWVFNGQPNTQNDSAFEEELLQMLIEHRG
ncbi:hypothetical protein [Ruegeria hyattellae]|uniref:hypothetical protein n=1 Tax=Ruegeria hyattellae TaxID=3233337 RepID=UPI00355AD251